jgi:hypothetical protein
VHTRFLAQITANGQSLPPEGFQIGHGSKCLRLRPTKGNRDVRASLCQGQRQRAPNASGAAGHKRPLTCQRPRNETRLQAMPFAHCGVPVWEV